MVETLYLLVLNLWFNSNSVEHKNDILKNNNIFYMDIIFIDI